MVDMSHYEKDENLQLTKELTEYCHARGIITEAEPGRINGGEDGVKVRATSSGRRMTLGRFPEVFLIMLTLDHRTLQSWKVSSLPPNRQTSSLLLVSTG